MKEKCYDVFKDYKLPFETYLTENINHENAVHEELEILWVIKGKAYVICDDLEFELDSQMVFLVYMYKEHSIRSIPGTITITYRLKKEHLHMHNLFFEKIPFTSKVYRFEDLAVKYRQVPLLIVQIIKLLLSNQHLDSVRYKIIGYYNIYIFDLYNMLLKDKYLDVKHVNPDEYLNRIHTIVEYTYSHFNEKISLETLAQMTNLSLYRLSHFIKEALGINYRTFLQNSRFEHALTLLKSTKLSISEISEQAGFSDIKYLNQMMKKRFKLTCLKFRKLALHENLCSDFNSDTYDFIQELKGCIKKIEQDQRFLNLFELKNTQQ